ncbi:unnamed protein product [Paramecium sonneborni]|uniref:Protein phosphatase methylesterase 1 n=1 Tax=Paramecium sonneborni TaxID=65129 RepID=A0A8S1PTI5_9CILI|nr:unnamed protein product [Paramecium sonneborni]
MNVKPLSILQEQFETQKSLFSLKKKAKHNWNQYYENLIIYNGIPIYSIIKSEPIILLIHGAGHCAMTFALLIQELKTFCSCFSYDIISHGQSERKETLTMQNLIMECQTVIEYIRMKFPNTNIILLGHSLGAAIASKLKHQSYIRGLIVIDMIENKAFESIQIMDYSLRKRPNIFSSYDSAINYHLQNSIIRNPNSAQITVPNYLNEKLEWKVDLIETKIYWDQWFDGIQNGFDTFPFQKMLFIAESDRIPTEQFLKSRYPIHIFENSGHNIHEDEPIRMAKHISDFLYQQRVPINSFESEKLKQLGIIGFRPKVLQYKVELKDII